MECPIPSDGTIDDQLQNINDDDENEDDVITHTLTLNWNENSPIMWPRYIACAFPTLYSTGSTDFHAEHIKDVKLAEYFRHLLYKNRRFAHHACWWYFALNS
jgi:hypothetical protein